MPNGDPKPGRPASRGGDIDQADAEALDQLATWSDWLPFAEAVDNAPRIPGVYVAREGTNGAIVYIGMAGERADGRRPEGLRGRLAIYRTGKGLVSGLGEAVFDRALADPVWVRERLDEIERDEPRRAKDWGREGFRRADLHIRWATTADKAAAVALERECLSLLVDIDLWNRAR